MSEERHRVHEDRQKIINYLANLTDYRTFQYNNGNECIVRSTLADRDDRMLTFKRPVPLVSQPRATVLLEGKPLEQKIVYHSPDGFEFGYGGSGPSDCALNVLLLVVAPKEAWRLHQDFKWDVISAIDVLPGGSLTMPVQRVLDWVRDRYAVEVQG